MGWWRRRFSGPVEKLGKCKWGDLFETDGGFNLDLYGKVDLEWRFLPQFGTWEPFLGFHTPFIASKGRL